MSRETFEVHDHAILADARVVLDASRSAREMQDAVIAAVKRNEDGRGQRMPEPARRARTARSISIKVGG